MHNCQKPINKRLFSLNFVQPRTLYQTPMSNTHREKYITKLLVGVGITSAGIFLIFYACFTRTPKDDWYLWGLIAAIVVNTGLIVTGSAFVHKTKSDLMRRQKQREQQKEQHKTFTAD
jgi:hypothetical protein